MNSKLNGVILVSVFLTAAVFSADRAYAQTLRVTLLGTGRPAPLQDRFEAATLVEAGTKTLLFDAGRGASIRIWQLGMPLRNIDAVFVTHFHHDHISGLADLSDPYDADKMAQGIDQLTQDASFRLRLVEKGLERVKTFSWDNAARETLAVLEQVVIGS